MSVLAIGFPIQQKKEASLALGLLWLTWATTNSWRAIYGGKQFYRPGAAAHSLIGGCGVCAFWHLAYWYVNTDSLRTGETIIIGVFVFFAALLAFNLPRLRREALALSTEKHH